MERFLCSEGSCLVTIAVVGAEPGTEAAGFHAPKCLRRACPLNKKRAQPLWAGSLSPSVGHCSSETTLMPGIVPEPSSACPGPRLFGRSRREMLRFGLAGMAALGLPELLQLRAGAAEALPDAPRKDT